MSHDQQLLSQQSPAADAQTVQKLPRRQFLAAAATLTIGSSVLAREFGPNAPPVRYPDPDIVVLDPRFAKYKIGNTPIQRIHLGNLWAEGPAWNGVGRYLLWSDIPNNLQRRWLEEDGHVTTFRQPAGNSNGNTFDYAGSTDFVRTRYAARCTLRTQRPRHRPGRTMARQALQRT